MYCQEEALIKAIKQQQTENVEELFRKGADVNKVSLGGRTPLMYAAYVGNVSILEILINAGADVNTVSSPRVKQETKDTENTEDPALNHFIDHPFGTSFDQRVFACLGQSSLMFAAFGRNSECIELLLKAGADVNAVDAKGNTALLLVGYGEQNRKDQYELSTELLLKAGADVNRINKECGNSLMLAAESGSPKCVEMMLKSGAAVNSVNKWGESALVLAAKKGHHNCVRLLNEYGADLNLQTENGGRFALLYAAHRGHYMCLKFLVEAGADVNLQDDSKYTALKSASECNHYACVDLLAFCEQINVDARGHNNTPLLHYVFSNRRTYMYHHSIFNEYDRVVALMARGAGVNWCDDNGTTALMLATKRNSMECVQYLLENGAHVNYSDVYGQTALMEALQGCCCRSSCACVNILQTLLARGADVNLYNNNGTTALMLAAKQHSMECVKLLLDNGALVNHADVNDQTALLEALPKYRYKKFFPCVNILQTLVTKGADVNWSDDNGTTALILAAKQGLTKCVKLLLKNGASVNHADLKGRTALLQALKCCLCRRSLACVNILLAAGADVNMNGRDTSALALAMKNGIRCMKTVLRAGAKVNQNYHHGFNALFHYILHSGQDESVMMIAFAGGEKLDIVTRSDIHQVLLSQDGRQPKPAFFQRILEHSMQPRPLAELKSICRDTIREHLLRIHSNKNLFCTVPELRLDPPVQRLFEEILLYEMSLDVHYPGEENEH